ncbi:hypothetical protein FSP39_007728 [Pinctada imbricata]|uniref:Protein kintoun n=1 Tax=Pinctada imbricata TaxID=66713 RepID=A0AA88XVU6_PINIB|nr:hypothetical protein FSP39_007728 [Pinctada imbricata]
MATNESKLKDLNLSTDEVKRIGECLKDENFRKLFVEYAEEIADPENRRRYEEEIQQMENERGMNVEFVHPNAGHVLKTTIDNKTKAFINICQNDKIDKPRAVPQLGSNGQRGINWQIPHSFSPPREDLDKNKNSCQIYDVVFNPDTYRMGNNPRFMKLIEDTAFDGIEKQFGVSIDRQNAKRMKTSYKGMPVATVIRKKNNQEKKDGAEVPEPLKDMPYPYSDKSSEEVAKEMRANVEKKFQKKAENQGKDAEHATPKYSIIHRSDVDLADYTYTPAGKNTRPKEITVSIELPLLKSAKDVDLDIFEQKLMLETKSSAAAKYKLDLKLPYPVDDENGTAKFDKSKRVLNVTLPVVTLSADETETDLPEPKPLIQESSEMNDVAGLEDLPELEEVESVCNGTETEESNSNTTAVKETSNVTLPDMKKSEAETDRKVPEETNDDLPDLEDLPELEEVEKTSNDAEPDCISSTGGEQKEVNEVIDYSYPQFMSNQDENTVSLAITVKSICQESVKRTYPNAHTIDLKFYTLGDGGFPIHYSLVVDFGPGNDIVPEETSVEFDDIGMVTVLLKDKECRSLWSKFQAGISSKTLLEFNFMKEDTVSKDLERLMNMMKDIFGDQEMFNEQNIQSEDAPKVEVTEMNKQKLTVKIKKQREENETDSSTEPATVQNEEEGDDRKVDSSHSEIEVVHDKALPNLHGILKQRSVSESSDDFSSSCSPTSPRDDNPMLRKSVSFNDRIDKASFKSGAAVSAMHKTLKNKRKRNRKREEKKNGGRRRVNSGGSEGSTSGEEGEFTRRRDVIVEEKVASSDQGESSQDYSEGSNNEDDGRDHIDEDEENKEKEEEQKVVDTEQKCLITEVTKESDKSPSCSDSRREDSVCNVESEVQDAEVTKKMQTSEDSKEKNTSNGKSKDGAIESEESSKKYDVENSEEGSGDSNSLWKNKEDTGTKVEHSGDKTNKVNGNSEDIGTMNHKTKCAFSFTNNVMFDLDID